MTNREAFEKWAANRMGLGKEDSGEYANPAARNAWCAWQAGYDEGYGAGCDATQESYERD